MSLLSKKSDNLESKVNIHDTEKQDLNVHRKVGKYLFFTKEE